LKIDGFVSLIKTNYFHCEARTERYIYIIQITFVNQLGFNWFNSRLTANADVEPKLEVAIRAFHIVVKRVLFKWFKMR
jgi:hypothetical protein